MNARVSSAILRERDVANAEAVSNCSNVVIPTIDMAAPKENIVETLWDAARNIGFFNIINHGIPQEDIDLVFDLSRQFFDLTSAEKQKYPFDTVTNSGYEFMKQAPPSTPGVVDQKESMQITTREGCMDGLWPTSLPLFRDTMEHIATLCHELGCSILSLLEAKACPHLKPGTLVDSHNLWNKDSQCTLRLLHYLPADKAVLAKNNLWRAGAHTDWGCITLLFQRMGEEGLECHANPKGDAKWVAVPPVQNAITVNIGDMLRLWSDSKLTSNLHRVRMPRTVEECQKSRYSVAFFLQADKPALIKSSAGCITADEYFSGRINSNFADGTNQL